MIASLALHKSWVVFVGTFFLGESVVLASSALAAHGVWSVWAVAAWAFVGTVISDATWLKAARAGVGRWTSDPKRSERLDLATRRLDRFTGEHPHRALLVVKFLYGTRIASITYMGIRGVKLDRFVVFDSMGTAVWLAVMVPIGWAIGMGLDALGTDLKKAEWVVLGIVVAAAMAKGARDWRVKTRA